MPKPSFDELDSQVLRPENAIVAAVMAAWRKFFGKFSAANASRTTSTSVLPVQIIGPDGGVMLKDIVAAEYETIAANATDQVIGATGATGDYLSGVLIVPGTTTAGAVSIKDGSGSAISIFAGGGTTALTTLIPFFVPLGIKSTAGAWKVTTGANVTAIAVGNFT